MNPFFFHKFFLYLGTIQYKYQIQLLNALKKIQTIAGACSLNTVGAANQNPPCEYF